MEASITVEIYDDGPIYEEALSGPCPDPSLIILDQEIRRLYREFGGGLRLTRHWLGHEPTAYREHPLAAALLRERGPSVLPITIVDGRVLRAGAYPSLGEIEPQPLPGFELVEYRGL